MKKRIKVAPELVDYRKKPKNKHKGHRTQSMNAPTRDKRSEAVFAQGVFRSENGKARLSWQGHGNYKGARVMNQKCHVSKKPNDQRFNHTDWCMGRVKENVWVEVYFRPYDETTNRRAHLAEKR